MKAQTTGPNKFLRFLDSSQGLAGIFLISAGAYFWDWRLGLVTLGSLLYLDFLLPIFISRGTDR